MRSIRNVLATITLVTILLVFALPVFAGTTNTGQSPEATDVSSTVINMLLIPLLPAVSAFVVALIRKKMQEIEQNIDDKDVRKYIFIADDAVCTAVAAVSQTYVDTLKKTQSFDSEAMKTAFNTAKSKALAIMGTDAQEVLKYLYGDINAWLENKIEYYVKMNNK